MEKQYDAFLDESNKKLATILSSPEYEENEKQLIVKGISNELEKHINDPGNMPDPDCIICQASVSYLDSELTGILSNSKADVEECRRGTALSERLMTLHSLFAEKKWPMPPVQQKDLQTSCRLLQKRQHNLSIVAEIHSLDNQLTILLSKAAVSMQKEKCDKADSCFQKLQTLVKTAEQDGIQYGPISNSNFKKIESSIEKIRNDAIKKEEMDSQMLELDSIICDAEIKGDADEKQWNEAIKLSKKQDTFITEYRTRQWPLPQLKRTNMAEVRDQYQTYQEMKKTDQMIRKKAEMTNTEAQFNELRSICGKQSSDIQKCERNKWRLPGKIIVDFEALEANVHSKVLEKIKEQQRRVTKLKAAGIAASVILLSVLILVGARYIKTHGKKQPPYNNAEVIGKKYEEVVSDFKTAGFRNVDIEEDTGGWLADGIVTRVAIGETYAFSRDVYFGEKENITVFFSSQGRKDISSELLNWKTADKQDLFSRMENAGLKKVSLVEKGTSDKSLTGKISCIRISGDLYESGPCYVPVNAPVEIEYYAYKIIIGKDTSGFAGKEYNSVIETLAAKGYKNIKAEAVNSGWQKGNTVVDVSINGSTEYKASDMFDDDAEIIVHYSSNDRIDITNLIKDWEKKPLAELQSELMKSGNKVVLKSTKTNNLSLHRTVANVSINQHIYESGDCFVRETDEITITFYRAAVRIGKDPKDINGQDYLEIKKYLKDKGFTNVVLQRTDDLWFPKTLIHIEKKIRSSTIDGNDKYSGNDDVYIDARIVLIVNTFNKQSYPGI